MPPLLDFLCLLQVSIDQELGMSASFFTVLAGGISLGLFIYLFYALLKAEKF
ncbi:K(+)-transporting ATPase subunit F [Alcaligenes faecalis]|nr:K(+)-transporting ATPase subunit F [Alcaligenes faecalis]